MNIQLLFFGIVRDVMATHSLVVEIPECSSVAELKSYLFTHYPNLRTYNNFTVAVNETYQEDAYTLKDNDIVALIPPVSGG